MASVLDCPPVLVVFFNRPDVLRKNIQALSTIRPARLFFACDGPRAGVSADSIRIAECIRVVEVSVDWACSVDTFYADTNQGCDDWVPKAVSWFFSRVDAGIILEDDCVIDSGFAGFAAELLKKYRDKPEVMNISAANFQRQTWGDGDYYYSVYPANWGWATWARAWKHYSQTLIDFDEFVCHEGGLDKTIDGGQLRFWRRFYRGLHSGRFTFWDAKWVFSIWRQGGVSITPNMNLVTNIGYGEAATHTKNLTSEMLRPIAPVDFPLSHPSGFLGPCRQADAFLYESRYRPRILARLAGLVKKILRLE